VAEFCKQCSIENFGVDHKEFAGLTTPKDWAEGYARTALCEGCGPIFVDPEGNCCGGCLLKHPRRTNEMVEVGRIGGNVDAKQRAESD